MVYIYTAVYYSALTRKEILTCARAWMNPEDIMLSEISQSHKDKYCVVPLIWSRETHTESGENQGLLGKGKRGVSA